MEFSSFLELFLQAKWELILKNQLFYFNVLFLKGVFLIDIALCKLVWFTKYSLCLLLILSLFLFWFISALSLSLSPLSSTFLFSTLGFFQKSKLSSTAHKYESIKVRKYFCSFRKPWKIGEILDGQILRTLATKYLKIIYYSVPKTC